jgi:tetratricopeptide (TPR) repeat protein
MKLAASISQPDNALAASLSDRALALCARAKDLEEAGEFEDARKTMSEFWQRIGDRPRVEGLTAIAQAELLLRAGALSGWIGGTAQIAGAQEIAKDLISEAAGAFEKLELVERIAEARIDLSICYWREGAFDEARITLDDALLRLGDLDSEQRLRAYLNKAIVEKVSNRYREALRLHREAAPLFEVCRSNVLRGKFHSAYGLVLKNLGLTEHRSDYLDRALIEFSAASFYLEQGNYKRFQGIVENNLGFLFVHLGRFQDAHEHLGRSRAVAVALKDQGLVAQFDDTRAQAFIAQGQYSKAAKIAQSSVKTLEGGDQLSTLAEALTTYGTALARLGSFSKARAALEKAITVANQAGDSEGGGVAALAMAEELANHLPFRALLNYYRTAESALAGSHNSEILARLAKCAKVLLLTQLPALSEVSPVPFSSNESAPNNSQLSSEQDGPPLVSLEISLEEQVLRYEGELIKRALENSDGSVTRAARLLGVTHQGLAFILNGRQKNLLPSRKPAKPRRRSIIRYH